MDLAAWQLEFHSGIPVYRQIVHRVQAAVAAGELSEGDRLPTIRALHEQLDVNPNTVARAYRELETLGVIQAQRGSGSFIAPQQKTAPALSPRARDAKLGEIVARLKAEAHGHQIPLNLIIERLRHDLPAS